MPKVEIESFWDRLGVELWPNYCFETQNFDFLGVDIPLGVGHVDLECGYPRGCGWVDIGYPDLPC